MKRFSAYFQFLFFISCFFSVGCSLEEEILDESTGTELLEQEDIELNLIAPAYGTLTTILDCCGTFALNEITSDEAVIPAKGLNWFDNGVWIELHEHTWTPEHASLFGVWNTLESGVARANAGLLLLSRQPSTIFSDELRAFQAELRFLRAYYKYHLLDLFRQVPMRDELDENYNKPPLVFNAVSAFNWLVDELESILPDLKEHGVLPGGRATQQAAYTLLAKLYLNAEIFTGTPEWDKCRNACDAVINSGHFQLADDYFQIFSYDNDQQNPEAIWTVRQSLETENNVFFSPAFTLHYQQNLGGFKFAFNGWATTEDFFYRWDDDDDLTNGVNTLDLRFQDERIKVATGANLGFLEGLQFHPDSLPIQDPQLSSQTGMFVQLNYTPQINGLTQALEHQGVRVMKYHPDPQSNAIFIGRNDFILFRYADVWLMKAEALLHSGSMEDALDMVNELRGKRGMPPLTNLNFDELLMERGFELYWEGYRRQDLIRFEQFTEGVWAFKNESESYRKVFPIPQSVLNVNENLVQNPGY